MHAPNRTLRQRRQPAAIALRATAAAAAVVALVSVQAACSAPPGRPAVAYHAASRTAGHGAGHGNGGARLTARTHEPSTGVSVLPGSSPSDTAGFARTLFAASPVVVVARDASATQAAARAAAAAHAPLLLAAGVNPRLAAAVTALHPRVVLVLGLSAGQLAVQLPGIRVVTRAASLPSTAPPAAPLSGTAVLVRAPGKTTASKAAAATGSAAVTAVTETARAAGAVVIDMPGPDPREYPQVIRELARLHPDRVVAVGTAFGPAARLRARLAVAETGRQLPGSGQVLFHGRRLVALYGHPGAPGLGVLGHQDLPASIARAKSMAAAYRALSGVPVIPAFEIIASVAEAAPGPDGSYSAVTPPSELLPWVTEATRAGLYVVLDLQPGRASLLAQAEDYESLLKLPDVGLALDPEWKLTPRQRPLHQIGHVDIAEANSVIRWLAALTERYRLPQKLLVLHQFRLDMLPGEAGLDTSHDNLAILVHMDGQGTPGQKQATWDAVTAAAPHGVYFGFKDFFVMDHPMLSPQQTMAHGPAPVMISYQ